MDSGSGAHQQRPALLRPVHRPDIERGIGVKALACRRPRVRARSPAATPGLRSMVLAEALTRAQCRSRSGATPRRCARRRTPRSRARSRGCACPDRHVALAPIAVEKGPGLRPGRRRHLNVPSRSFRPRAPPGCAPSSGCPCGTISGRISRWANAPGRRRARSRPSASPCRERS